MTAAIRIYGEGFVAHGSTGDYTLDEDNASGKEWRKASRGDADGCQHRFRGRALECEVHEHRGGGRPTGSGR